VNGPRGHGDRPGRAEGSTGLSDARDPQQHPCPVPWCLAQPGQPCRDLYEGAITGHHAGRYARIGHLLTSDQPAEETR
jgi:hypothetical protein